MITTVAPDSRRASIVSYLKTILMPGAVTELRALEVTTDSLRRPHTASGYFDDWNALADAAVTLDNAVGIYIIPNAVDPALLARAVNRVRDVVGRDSSTTDAQIVSRRWLLVDADAIRPSGISATDEEHLLAIARASEVRDALTSLGWPLPILGDSGNGGHLMYRIDLPADDGGLVQAVLSALQFRFGDADVKIDESVHNPARIWKLYGTVARKGDSTADRPHRLAQVLEMPERLEVVSRELLEALAASVPVDEQPAGRNGGASGPKLDLPAWITSHDLKVSGPSSWTPKDGRAAKRWIFETCPWNPEHTNRSAWLVQFDSGAVAAGCQHDSCRSRGWRELRAVYPASVAPTEQAATAGDSTSTVPPERSVPVMFPQADRGWADLIAWREPRPACLLGDGLLRVRQLGMIHGRDGSRKSWILLTWGLCAAGGQNFFGIEMPEPIRVGLISLEDDAWTLRDRAVAIATKEELDRALLATNFHYISPPVFDLALDVIQPGQRDALRDWILRHRLQLVLLDHLTRVHSLEDERQLGAISAALIDLCRECNVACVVNHHDRKGIAGGKGRDSQAARGDSRFIADCRFIAHAVEVGDRIRFDFEKTTGARKPDTIWLAHDDAFCGALKLVGPPKSATEQKQSKKQRLAELIRGAGRKGIAPSGIDATATFGVQPDTVSKWARELVTEGAIRKVGRTDTTRWVAAEQLPDAAIRPEGVRESAERVDNDGD